jgi:hypothetical protein
MSASEVLDLGRNKESVTRPTVDEDKGWGAVSNLIKSEQHAIMDKSLHGVPSLLIDVIGGKWDPGHYLED